MQLLEIQSIIQVIFIMETRKSKLVASRMAFCAESQSQRLGRIAVIREDQLRTHNLDFLLERDGVFRSWARAERSVGRTRRQAPRGTCRGSGPGLSVISRARFPTANTVRIWDHGDYDAEKWTDQQIACTLHGAQASGRFNLIRLSHGRPNEWLIIK